ncbi:MAG: antifreeze protein [Sulfitobacter sp.]
MKLQNQMTSLMLDTQTVMTLRLMGVSGAIPARRGENDMVAEKAPAMVDAFTAGAKAAMAGNTPDQIMSAAIKPLSQKVRANRKRLTK